jgi:hypothetical protein
MRPAPGTYISARDHTWGGFRRSPRGSLRRSAGARRRWMCSEGRTGHSKPQTLQHHVSTTRLPLSVCSSRTDASSWHFLQRSGAWNKKSFDTDPTLPLTVELFAVAGCGSCAAPKISVHDLAMLSPSSHPRPCSFVPSRSMRQGLRAASLSHISEPFARELDRDLHSRYGRPSLRVGLYGGSDATNCFGVHGRGRPARDRLRARAREPPCNREGDYRDRLRHRSQPWIVHVDQRDAGELDSKAWQHRRRHLWRRLLV